MKITNALTIPNHLGILVYDVDVKESSKRLQEAMHAVMAKYANMQTSDVAKMPAIAATRKAYSTLGKSPSRYRNAAEAMIRRIVKKQGLYQINNVVDLAINRLANLIENLCRYIATFAHGSYGICRHMRLLM